MLGMSIAGYSSSGREYHWLLSVSAGIVMCKVIYKLTGEVSSLLFKGYAKLNDAEKLEWNNRGFSTFHALVAAFVSLYLLLLSDLFDEGYHEELLINRRSTLSDTMFGISIGYFLSDLAMIFWTFPALGGMEYKAYLQATLSNQLDHSVKLLGKWAIFVFSGALASVVLHHGLSLIAFFLSLASGQAQIYILMVLFSEITTPFVNLRWYLDVAGQKSSRLYIFNGVALFLGWLVARVLLFIFFFYHLFTHFDQVKKVFPLGFYSLLTISPTLAVMNLFWFWKITKGMIKTLSKARYSQ